MARGVNKAIIVGTLGQDPEIRYTANGSAVANISVATNESWKDKATGEAQERTEWHRIVMFGKLAEIAQQRGDPGATQQVCPSSFMQKSIDRRHSSFWL